MGAIERMRLLNYIAERSFNQENIPKYFRVAIYIGKDDSDKRLNQLANMELKGLKGISDSGEIIFNFFGVGSDTFLMMDGQKTVKLNKLSRMMYDNPHYFLSNNMSALKRMYSKPQNDNRGVWHNIADKIFREFANMGLIGKYDISANAPGQAISWTKVAKTKKVNGVKDAVKTFILAMKEALGEDRNKYTYRYFKDLIALGNKKIEDVLLKIFDTEIGAIYADEGEWLVKNGSLKIPTKSYLYVLTSFTNKQIKEYQTGKADSFFIMRYEKDVEKEIARKEHIMKTLKGKYTVKFVHGYEWDKIRTKHFTKKYEKG